MNEDITGYDGEKIGEVVDHHDDSGSYLGTAFVEKRGCWELLIFLPFLGMIYYVYQIISSV